MGLTLLLPRAAAGTSLAVKNRWIATLRSLTCSAVLARYVRNRRLAAALTWWPFSSLKASPGARACYDRHRAAGNTHHQALRACPTAGSASSMLPTRHRTTYHEITAWGTPDQKIEHAA